MTPTKEDAGNPAVHENGARGIVRRVYVSGDGRPMREEVRVEVTVAGATGAPVGFYDSTEGWTLEAPPMFGASTRIRLYPSGILFTPFDPRPEDIRIEDVAHGLACTNRFGGHLPEPYNVAHHCLIVSELCEEQPRWALLHEVAEALSGLGDVCGPTKRHPSIRGPVKALEHGIERAASVAFGLPDSFASAPCVKAADLLAYAWEDRDLRGATDDDAWVHELRPRLPSKRLVPMGWREAERTFLRRFADLWETSR